MIPTHILFLLRLLCEFFPKLDVFRREVHNPEFPQTVDAYYHAPDPSDIGYRKSCPHLFPLDSSLTVCYRVYVGPDLFCP